MARAWFDAHLDLACLAVLGRDMHAPLDRCGGPWQPAAVSLASMRGVVTHCLGTIFTEAGGTDEVGYPAGDAEAAHSAGLTQLLVYEKWWREGQAQQAGGASTSDAPTIAMLMEGADPIREPIELEWWADEGVVAVGLAWARGTRYAGGNTQAHGLTDLGRALIPEMDRLGLVHDLSHLSDVGAREVLELATGQVMASHSNCRAIVEPGAGDGEAQRHLSDDMIRAIVGRGGMIGLNLFDRFLVPAREQPRRATIADCVRHIEHVCELAGDRHHVGLGSDLDGGLTADQIPVEVRSHADLEALLSALRDRGWSDGDLAGMAWGNWARFWSRASASRA
jgi:membrane dipeptidase